MVGKARVHELAKEFGVESKEVLAKLKEMGEFVKSPSSTIEPPVARKLREIFPAVPEGAAEPAAEAKPAAKKAPAKKTTKATPVVAEEPDVAAAIAPAPAPEPVVAEPEPIAPAASFQAPAAAAPPASAPAVPRPAPRPAARPGGNNPFMSPQDPDLPRPARPAGEAMPRPGGTGGLPSGMPPRPGGPRPGPGTFPPRPGGAPRPGFAPRPGGGPGAGGPGGARPGFGQRPGGGPGGGGPGGGGAGGGGFNRAGGPGGGGGPAGRGAGRGGGTAGAFGRPGAPRGKQRKSKRAKRIEFDNLQAPSMEMGVARGNGEVVRLHRGASLFDFAEKINANPGSLVQIAFTELNEMVTATQSCSDQTLELLGVQLGYDVQIVSPEDEDRELLDRFGLEFGAEYGDDAELVQRPPVVTVMGHVDHGKTRLLDAIRNTEVVAGEAGGITQHIGAYQVHHTSESTGERLITFIDTPGHEAFTAMRARGAKVTDIAVLVVAADDGVKPQTIEALNHAKAADVPIVVAVNKIDKPDANPEKVRQQLTEYGLVTEEYGGDTMFVNVSARENIGIDDLLEAILLTADAALEMTADPTVQAQGVAIEAHLDKGRGPVATVLVQRGTLRVGDSIVAGEAFGRVRAMLDEHGNSVEEALPARPVLVLGFTSVPGAGDNFLVVEEDRLARQIAEQRQARERNAALAKNRGRVTLETWMTELEKGKLETLNLILKGDVSGSVEALEDALLQIDVGEEVSLRIIDRGVGAITETNVDLAAASDAIIIGFNVRPEGRARDLAQKQGVDVRYYSVIYAAIEEIESALKGMLKPEFEEVQLGTAEVREVFRVPKIGNVAGALVRSGTIVRNSKARLIRDGIVVNEHLSVESLRRFKDDATEVRDGYECGIGLGSFNDIKIGDVIETFEMREKPRT